MGDSNDRKHEAPGQAGSKDPKDRSADATSDKTVSDLEESEADSSSSDADLDPGPSPDGMLDEPDEVKDAGPM